MNALPSLFIDSDNALGALFGDVDDGFAIAALIRSGLPIDAIATVFGNTFEALAYRNTKSLTQVCGYSGKLLRGASTWWSGPTEASRHLKELRQPVRALALGPMTNFALALKGGGQAVSQISELVFVGTNYSLRLPAFRFTDFNQWKDPLATRAVFSSPWRLTCVPCDVARRLRVTPRTLDAVTGAIGRHLRQFSARWFLRSRLLKWSSSVPIWDLVAAMYVIEPGLFQVSETQVKLGRLGQATYGDRTGRPVKVITGFDSDEVWHRFVELLAQTK